MEGPVRWFGLAAILLAITTCPASPALAQNYGTVSDGSCSCKTRCDGGNSRFSAGHTVAQCRALCVQSFSGCSRGEIRLPGVRAGQRVQSGARSAAAPSTPARSAGARRRITCDRTGCHHHVQSWQPIAGRNCVAVPHGIHLTGKGGINKTGWARRPFYRCA
jgi:hypothetical protein